LTGVEATAFAIADNRSAELAEWSNDLAGVLKSLADANVDLAELGFAQDDLEKISKDFAGITEDEVPEPPVEPITKMGNLWILGDHRVMCGDSMKADDVARLMRGEKANAVIADPPYGMMLDADYSKINNATHVAGRKHEKIIGDDVQFDPRPIFNLFQSDEVLMFGADYYAAFLPQGSWLVWDKRVEERYDSIIGSAFELIWSKKKRKREIIRHEYSSWTSRTEDTVNGIKAHPTMKPVKVIAAIILKTESILIADPFLGSGTTLIAADQLGRKCYGMEISPAYCDVVVQRWENITGKKAVLENRIT